MGLTLRSVVEGNDARTRIVLDGICHKDHHSRLGGVELAEPRERQQHIHHGQEARAAVL
jgi:hypothetical protein